MSVYYAIHKPTGKRYDIPETAHGTMFRLIERWAEIGRDAAMKRFREHGKIETRAVVFHRVPLQMTRPEFNGVVGVGRLQ